MEWNPRLRRRIEAGVRAGAALELIDGVRFAAGWQELGPLADRRAGSPVFLDPFGVAGKGRMDDMATFHRAHPASPLIFYAHVDASRQRCLEGAGVAFAAALVAGVNDRLNAIGAAAIRATAKHEADALTTTLQRISPPSAHGFLARLVTATLWPCRVGDLAKSLGTSAVALRRRCRAWGLPAPRRLVALSRLFHVQRLARWSGRPQRTVALALGWSDYANYVRSIRNELGCRASELGRLGGATHVATRLRQVVQAGRPETSGLR